MPGNRFRAAIIPFSAAGPFRIFAECTASFKRIANSREFHSAKSALSSSFGGLVRIRIREWAGRQRTAGETKSRVWEASENHVIMKEENL
jgi:hypothetical protein